MNRPVLRYFGGKFLLAPWIISHFPEHRIYVEPFGGAASVLMQKKRSYAEVYNDLDNEVVNLFRVLQDKSLSQRLQSLLEITPYARSEFDLSYEETDCKIEKARRLIIRSFMGFGADSHNKANGKTGFRANSNRSGSTPAHDWTRYPKEIELFCQRLSGVVIENRDAVQVMKTHDSIETLHFVDPPYVHSTRKKGNGYVFEMKDKDHEILCEEILQLNGMVIICGYKNDIYNNLTGWQQVACKALADGASPRKEILWLNKAVQEKQSQISFII